MNLVNRMQGVDRIYMHGKLSPLTEFEHYGGRIFMLANTRFSEQGDGDGKRLIST